MKLRSTFYLIGFLVFSLTGCITTKTAQLNSEGGCLKADNITFVDAGHECLALSTVKGTSPTVSPLFIWLHGTQSQYLSGDGGFQLLLKNMSDVKALQQMTKVAIMSPGYYSTKGLKSSGKDARNTRVYNVKADIKAISNAIRRLNDFYKPSEIWLVGHSKGAGETILVLPLLDGVPITNVIALSGIVDMGRWTSTHSTWNWNYELSVVDHLNGLKGFNGKIYAVGPANDRSVEPYHADILLERAPTELKDNIIVSHPPTEHNGVLTHESTAQLFQKIFDN
jgi:hypothetical protein